LIPLSDAALEIIRSTPSTGSNYVLTQSAHAPAMDAIDAAMHQLARIERGAKFHIQRGVFQI